MKRIFVSFGFSIVAMLVLAIPVFGQDTKSNPENETCSQPVYDRKAVSRPAQIIHRPEPGSTEEARAKQLKGKVVLDAVLCKSGNVTDIIVVEGQPHGMTEKMIEAVKQVKFRAAEKDGQQVSQKQRFIYEFYLY
jgi:TonB family protein